MFEILLSESKVSRSYNTIRNSYIIKQIVGIPGYIKFPVAPPRHGAAVPSNNTLTCNVCKKFSVF